MNRLRNGDPAPPFELPGSDGQMHRLSDHAGRRAVVLAWFPRAFTGGWSSEVRSLRESGPQIRRFDVAYFGASTDGPDKNERFAEVGRLDFPVLSDPDKQTARAYGVLKLGLFAARHTVYIDVDGKVMLVDREVSARTAGQDMVRRLEELGVSRK